MKVDYQWLRTDTTLTGSEIISSKSFRDFDKKRAWDMILDPPMLPKFLNNYEAQKRHEHMNMNICLSYFLHMIYQDECWLPVAMG